MVTQTLIFLGWKLCVLGVNFWTLSPEEQSLLAWVSLHEDLVYYWN